ncbi:TPA: DUF3265 domain-containing protein [Vibrio parahaemolyticus]|nr:DUF3265 domain-containing protein [Vibrio parahaemolyticus]EGR1145993.1 DUF3265 domain-containing protein [Vibrio parahaemolyticus]EGR2360861.1 DUF3265 domain-containing protein [Vibrio parahaemolyticus]EGR3365931.1 DUF3265 domain-containing protein [Vibrio parahaemolyticus]EGR3426472.1 DUF3265 domain-containing protein [Vibrio parahaemolyticus]EHQ9269889.1 DUF3265 domain-containing protein [Vibrio parahaemolyticus]
MFSLKSRKNVSLDVKVKIVKPAHNKQFKRDSARVAFLLCVGFCVEVPYSNIGIACFTP